MFQIKSYSDGTIQESIYNSVKGAMKELKVTRAELSRRLGTSRAAVTEMFQENWTIDRLQTVAEALGISIEITLHLPSEAKDA